MFPPGVEASTAFDFSQPATAETPGFLLIDVDPGEVRHSGIDRESSESSGEIAQWPGESSERAGASGAAVRSGCATDPAWWRAWGRRRARPSTANESWRRSAAVPPRREGTLRPDPRPLGRLGFAAVRLRHPLRDHGAGSRPCQTLADGLATRLSQDGSLTDVWSGPRPVTVPSVDIDRAKAAAMGVSLAEISAWIQPVLGPVRAGSIKGFGRTWPVWVEFDWGRPIDIDTLEQLKVRNDKGEMVPFRSIATLRQDRAPDRLERVDLFPAVSITASLAGGVSLAEARFVCEGLAEEVLATEGALDYRLAWLRVMPAARRRPGRSRPWDSPN